MNRSIFLLQVVGMYGGFQAEGIKTVLPSEAHVKFAMRLVPGQSPDTAWTLLEKHVKKVAKELTPGVTVTLTRMKKGEKAYVANRNSTSTTLLGEVLDELIARVGWKVERRTEQRHERKMQRRIFRSSLARLIEWRHRQRSSKQRGQSLPKE